MPFLMFSLKSSLHVFVVCSACCVIACWCVQVTGCFAGMPVPRLTLFPLFMGKVCRSIYAIFTSFATVSQSTKFLAVFEINAFLCCGFYAPQIQSHSIWTAIWIHMVEYVVHAVQWAVLRWSVAGWTRISCFHSVLLPLLRNTYVGTEAYLKTEASLKS